MASKRSDHFHKGIEAISFTLPKRQIGMRIVVAIDKMADGESSRRKKFAQAGGPGRCQKGCSIPKLTKV